ncbi:MAG: class I SAM-dependent methyltransferase [Pseudomonadota bacterium]
MADSRSPVQNTITFLNSQGDRARGTLMKLSPTSLVMEVYNPYSIVQLSEVLDDIEITRGSQLVYKGKGVVSNLVNTGLMLIVSATLVDQWKNLADLGAESGVRDEAKLFVDGWTETQNLYSGYQLIVGKIRSFLYELNLWMDQMGFRGEEGEDELSRKVLDDIIEPILPALQEMFLEFEKQAAQIDNNDLMTHKLYAQHDLHPLLMRSPFVHRTFTKPLGYAGDYEMVNMMLRDGWEGPTAYAKIVNYFHIMEGPAEAHRNRIKILTDLLEKIAIRGETENRRIRILNIACGPAIEIQRFILGSKHCESCDFTLLDFSEETLDYTRSKIEVACMESGREMPVRYIHQSVHTLLKQVHAEEVDLGEDTYDLVYCAGLFDYLSDRVCSRLLRLFYRLIVPSGKVMVTNVDPSNNAVSLMEHLLEWYLVYRNEEQLAKLVRGVGEQNTYSDDTGMNVFLEIAKPAH